MISLETLISTCCFPDFVPHVALRTIGVARMHLAIFAYNRDGRTSTVHNTTAMTQGFKIGLFEFTTI